MPYVSVSGLELYYEQVGAGPPVILLHGAGQDTRSWRFVIENVGRYASAVALDLPGHGKSDFHPKGPIADLHTYAEIVADAVQTLELRNAAIVGHSMSAGIALLVALQWPELISKVIAVDGGGETNGTHGGDLLEIVGVNPADYFEENFRSICSPQTDPERVEAIARDVGRCHPDVVYADIRAYSRLSLDVLLPKLRCPVTFLHGVDDWSIPIEIAETSAQLIPEATVVPLAHVGHFPHVERPDLFNKHLREALETHSDRQ